MLVCLHVDFTKLRDNVRLSRCSCTPRSPQQSALGSWTSSVQIISSLFVLSVIVIWFSPDCRRAARVGIATCEWLWPSFEATYCVFLSGNEVIRVSVPYQWMLQFFYIEFILFHVIIQNKSNRKPMISLS